MDIVGSAVEATVGGKDYMKNMNSVLEELTTTTAAAKFVSFGRNIFSMSNSLIEMLGQTDLKDVRLSDIKLPLPCFYVSFGDGIDVALPGAPNKIDGAYVDATAWNEGGEIVITFTSKRTDAPNQSASWFDRHEGSCGSSFGGDGEREHTWDEEFESQLGGIRVGASANDFPEIPKKVVDESLRVLEASFLQIRQPLSLLVNALCYLTAVPEDVEDVWPADTPPDLLQQLRNGRPGERDRARAQLLDRGFSVLKVVRGPGLSLGEGADGDHDHAGMPSHWRKGHWRRQAHGPAYSLHKLIWLKPTIVRHDLGDPEGGHVYKM
jgi:hypothetical protein